jgi:hypothetical protein
VLDVGKYRILDARVEAWVRVLGEAGIAQTHDVPAEPRIAAHRPVTEMGRVRQVRPTKPGGLSMVFATTLVNGAPFGLDLGVAHDEQQPVTLAGLPDCGCDACDDGSA